MSESPEGYKARHAFVVASLRDALLRSTEQRSKVHREFAGRQPFQAAQPPRPRRSLVDRVADVAENRRKEMEQTNTRPTRAPVRAVSESPVPSTPGPSQSPRNGALALSPRLRQLRALVTVADVSGSLLRRHHDKLGASRKEAAQLDGQMDDEAPDQMLLDTAFSIAPGCFELRPNEVVACLLLAGSPVGLANDLPPVAVVCLTAETAQAPREAETPHRAPSEVLQDAEEAVVLPDPNPRPDARRSVALPLQRKPSVVPPPVPRASASWAIFNSSRSKIAVRRLPAPLYADVLPTLTSTTRVVDPDTIAAAAQHHSGRPVDWLGADAVRQALLDPLVSLCRYDATEQRLVCLDTTRLCPAVGAVFSVARRLRAMQAHGGEDRDDDDESVTVAECVDIVKMFSAAAELDGLSPGQDSRPFTPTPSRARLLSDAPPSLRASRSSSLRSPLLMSPLSQQRTPSDAMAVLEHAETIASVEEEKYRKRLLANVLGSVQGLSARVLKVCLLPAIMRVRRRRTQALLLHQHRAQLPRLTGAHLSRAAAVLSLWPRELLDQLAAAAEVRVVEPGQAIVYRGEPAQLGLLVIAAGFGDVEPTADRRRDPPPAELVTPRGDPTPRTSSAQGARSRASSIHPTSRPAAASLPPFAVVGQYTCFTGEGQPVMIRASLTPGGPLVPSSHTALGMRPSSAHRPRRKAADVPLTMAVPWPSGAHPHHPTSNPTFGGTGHPLGTSPPLPVVLYWAIPRRAVLDLMTLHATGGPGRLPSTLQRDTIRDAFRIRSERLALATPMTAAKLQQFPSFAACSLQTLTRLAAVLRPLSLPKGTVLVERGGPPSTVYFLVHGLCGLHRHIPTDVKTPPKAATTAITGPSDQLIPLSSGLARLTHVQTVKAPAELGAENALFGAPFTISVSLLTNCDFFTLARDDLDVIFFQGNHAKPAGSVIQAATVDTTDDGSSPPATDQAPLVSVDAVCDEWRQVLDKAKATRQEQLRKGQSRCKPYLMLLPLIGPFLATNPRALSELLALFEPHVYQPGDVVLSRSRSCDRVVVLSEGGVRLANMADNEADPAMDPGDANLLLPRLSPRQRTHPTRSTAATPGVHFVVGESVGVTCLLPHRWTKTFVAASVSKTLELPRDAFTAFLKAHGQYQRVLGCVKALLFPVTCGDPKVLLEAVTAMARLGTPTTYPVSSSDSLALSEFGFGCRMPPPVPRRRVPEDEPEGPLRQQARDRAAASLQLSTAAKFCSPTFARLLRSDEATTLTAVAPRRAATPDPKAGRSKGAGRWTAGKAMLCPSR